MTALTAEKETAQISLNLARTLLKHYRPSAKVLPKIAALIRKHKKFLLTTHVGADADGLGSQAGLYYLLKSLKKDVVIVNSDPVPSYLKNLMPESIYTHLDVHATEEATREVEHILKDRFVFIVDSSDIHRSGLVAEIFTRMKNNWATIDHHILPAKKEFCVDPSYCATAELVWDLYHFLKRPLKAEAALPLYAGLVADSGNFRYSKTSLRSHIMGGELIAFGIHSDSVYRAIYESHERDRIRLYARLFKKIKILPNDVVTLSVLQKDRKGLNLGDGGTEGIVNHLLAHKTIKAAALMTQTEKNELKCSLRSIGDVDVASLAKQFGGGGHKNAAGLKISEKFSKAEKKLLAAISKL